MTKLSYTEKEFQELKSLYLEEEKSVEEIAKILNKSVRSIISKLAKEKIYIPKERKSKRLVPSKKELVLDIENITGLHFKALVAVNREDLIKLKEYIENN